MVRGGAILTAALQAAVNAVRPGVTMADLDQIATSVIEQAGGSPSFRGYRSGASIPFPATLCISRNEEVVHGIGTRKIKLEDGDIVGLDIGCWYEGLCTDMAVTVPVGKITPAHLALLATTRAALRAGVTAATIGNNINHIGVAVSALAENYGVVRSLVGHGVGHAVHEPPNVPNYPTSAGTKIPLKAGMCLALEPMFTLGTSEVTLGPDGWSILTKDQSWSAHFEVTIAITPDGPLLITPEPVVPGLD